MMNNAFETQYIRTNEKKLSKKRKGEKAFKELHDWTKNEID